MYDHRYAQACLLPGNVSWVGIVAHGPLVSQISTKSGTKYTLVKEIRFFSNIPLQ